MAIASEAMSQASIWGVTIRYFVTRRGAPEGFNQCRPSALVRVGLSAPLFLVSGLTLHLGQFLGGRSAFGAGLTAMWHGHIIGVKSGQA